MNTPKVRVTFKWSFEFKKLKVYSQQILKRGQSIFSHTGSNSRTHFPPRVFYFEREPFFFSYPKPRAPCCFFSSSFFLLLETALLFLIFSDEKREEEFCLHFRLKKISAFFFPLSALYSYYPRKERTNGLSTWKTSKWNKIDSKFEKDHFKRLITLEELHFHPNFFFSPFLTPAKVGQEQTKKVGPFFFFFPFCQSPRGKGKERAVLLSFFLSFFPLPTHRRRLLLRLFALECTFGSFLLLFGFAVLGMSTQPQKCCIFVDVFCTKLHQPRKEKGRKVFGRCQKGKQETNWILTRDQWWMRLVKKREFYFGNKKNATFVFPSKKKKDL